MVDKRDSDPLQTTVGVVPHTRVQSLGKALSQGNPVTFMDRMTLGEALEKHHDSPALFTDYYIDGEEKLPRLAKKDEAWVTAKDRQVRVHSLAVDYDLPKTDGEKTPWADLEEAEEFLASLAEKIPDLWPTVFYTTKHGARLIYVLTCPLTTSEAEQAYIKLLARLRESGIESDENTKDWTRLFVLPFATKFEVDDAGNVTNEEKLWENPTIFCETYPDSVLVPDILLAFTPTQSKAARDDAPPDPKVCEKLREVNADKLRMFTDAAGLSRSDKLRGALDGKLQTDKGRDTGLYFAAKDCAEALVLQTWAGPELVFALLEPIAMVMSPDKAEPGKAWADVLWEKVCRTWDAEDSKSHSTKDRLGTQGIEYALDTLSWDHPSNDTSNAKVMERIHGDVIRYAMDRQAFFVYQTNAGRWVIEGKDRPALKHMARVLQPVWCAWQSIHKAKVKRIEHDISTTTDDYEKKVLASARNMVEAEAKRCRSQANHSANLNGILAAIGLLLGQPTLQVDKEDEAFDVDPNLLNVRNGILRLPTKDNPNPELLPHDPKYMCSKQANVYYDENAKSPKFNDFIKWMHPDPDTREYFQRICGTHTSGRREQQAFTVCEGRGRNGKSVYFDTALTILGDYAVKAPRHWLTPQRNKQDFSTINMRGGRLVVASETSKGNQLDASLLKELTGDKFVKARGLYHGEVVFKILFELILLTNDPPEIIDDSEGLWRRMRSLLCLAVIDDCQEDPELVDKLVAEGPGILNWMLEGLRKYRVEGLQEPQSVIEATAVYRIESDPVRGFMDEKVVKRVNAREPVSNLYQEYALWCASQGTPPGTYRSFTKRLWGIYGKKAKSKAKDGHMRDKVVLQDYALRKRHATSTSILQQPKPEVVKPAETNKPEVVKPAETNKTDILDWRGKEKRA